MKSLLKPIVAAIVACFIMLFLFIIGVYLLQAIDQQDTITTFILSSEMFVMVSVLLLGVEQ